GSTATQPTKPVGSSSTIQSDQKANKSNNKVSATEQAKAKADSNNVVDNTKPVKPTTEPTKPVDMTELPHTNDNNSVGLQAVGFLLTLFGLGGLVSLKKQKQ
ncbi:LPXTG cell wall anchor domain-containing protein, partial [Streptococcus sp. HMSC10E12]|uniref:LPXTG cell wall anchor domain-containing protein n=1 Tax=Streptococcus sp. HMSC10E12 TaxID=1581080 RepID=UPI00114CEA0B